MEIEKVKYKVDNLIKEFESLTNNVEIEYKEDFIKTFIEYYKDNLKKCEDAHESIEITFEDMAYDFGPLGCDITHIDKYNSELKIKYNIYDDVIYELTYILKNGFVNKIDINPKNVSAYLIPWILNTKDYLENTDLNDLINEFLKDFEY